jgi:hypothetical protein
VTFKDILFVVVFVFWVTFVFYVFWVARQKYAERWRNDSK